MACGELKTVNVGPLFKRGLPLVGLFGRDDAAEPMEPAAAAFGCGMLAGAIMNQSSASESGEP